MAKKYYIYTIPFPHPLHIRLHLPAPLEVIVTNRNMNKKDMCFQSKSVRSGCVCSIFSPGGHTHSIWYNYKMEEGQSTGLITPTNGDYLPFSMLFLLFLFSRSWVKSELIFSLNLCRTHLFGERMTSDSVMVVGLFRFSTS